MTLSKVQQLLVAAGYDPGPVDGIMGPLTIRAIRRFQADKGLLVDGIVGPKTAAALGAKKTNKYEDTEFQTAPWMDVARSLIGTREIPGNRSNPDILDWAEGAGIDYDNDDIPWCGLFVHHCIRSALPHEPTPSQFLTARRWLKFGLPVKPAIGSVLVFWRGKRNGWRGHVGFYAGEDSACYHVLGGNQSNSVSVARIRKDRLLEARWPVAAPKSSKILWLSAKSEVSTNEA